MANLSTLNETSNNFTNQASQMNSSALLSGLSSKLYGLTEGKISEGLTSIATRIKSFIPERNYFQLQLSLKQLWIRLMLLSKVFS